MRGGTAAVRLRLSLCPGDAPGRGGACDLVHGVGRWTVNLPILSLVTFAPLIGAALILALPRANAGRYGCSPVTSIIMPWRCSWAWWRLRPGSWRREVDCEPSDPQSGDLRAADRRRAHSCLAASECGAVRLQSGYVYHYALAMLLGVVALATWFMASGGGL